MLMISTVLRNFLKRPATRKYPFTKRDSFPLYRGRLINSVESCIFCRACSNKCPAQCISTDPKEAFWGYDPFSCVYCGVCVDSCPTHSLFMLSSHRMPVPNKFVIYHKGVARVERTKNKSIPSAPHRSETPSAVPSVNVQPVKEPPRPVSAATPDLKLAEQRSKKSK